MNNKTPLISCTFAVLAGICFVSGLVILKNEGGIGGCTDLKMSY